MNSPSGAMSENTESDSVSDGEPPRDSAESTELAAAFGRMLPALQAVASRKLIARRPPAYTASDLVQDAVQVALTKGEDERNALAQKAPESLMAWMIGVMRNIVRDRSRRRPIGELGDTDVAVPQGPSPASVLVIEEDLRRIESAKALLSDRERDILRLRDDEGLTFREIGEKLGFTESYASRIYKIAYENISRIVRKD